MPDAKDTEPTIPWSQIPDFSPDNFSEDPDKYAQPRFMRSLQRFRDALDERIWPSPVSGALARHDGSEDSRHYVGGDSAQSIVRRCDAGDFFCEGNVVAAYSLALACGEWGAVGLYADTTGPDGQDWPMLHLDKRPLADDGGKHPFVLTWLKTDNGDYVYPQFSASAQRKLRAFLCEIAGQRYARQ